VTHSEEKENPEFVIRNRKEIAAILGDLVKLRTAINLDTQDGMSLVTSILKVSNEGNYVYLDISQDNRINDQIIHSKHVNLSTQTGIKVRWHTTHLHRVALPDGDALSMAFPAVIERIQRREYFRLNTPQGKEVLICKIPVDDNNFEATILDMSAGGMGVSIKGILPDNFSQGGQFTDCSINFPEIGIVPVGLRICRVWETSKTKTGEQVNRFGMEFVNLSRGASNVIQRHINQLQAESLATLRVP
jgi:c-di-GMP-binding flagellar brake protein YcgR